MPLMLVEASGCQISLIQDLQAWVLKSPRKPFDRPNRQQPSNRKTKTSSSIAASEKIAHQRTKGHFRAAGGSLLVSQRGHWALPFSTPANLQTLKAVYRQTPDSRKRIQIWRAWQFRKWMLIVIRRMSYQKLHQRIRVKDSLIKTLMPKWRSRLLVLMMARKFHRLRKIDHIRDFSVNLTPSWRSQPLVRTRTEMDWNKTERLQGTPIRMRSRSAGESSRTWSGIKIQRCL